MEDSNGDQRRRPGAVTGRVLLPAGMRLRADTVRIDGVRIDAVVQANGREFAVTLPGIAASRAALLTYLAEVVVSAQPGHPLNPASATDNRGTQSNIPAPTISIQSAQLGNHITNISPTPESRR